MAMIDTFTIAPRSEALSVTAQAQRANRTWWKWYACISVLTLAVAALMIRRGPNPALIAWLLYAMGVVAILYRPRYGVYLILGFSLAGDRGLMYWYPFVKNFSSIESLLYVNDAIIISPAESYILLTFMSWLGRAAFRRKLDSWHTGPLFWPMAIFLIFVVLGIQKGFGQGGDRVIGLWEARPMFYLAAMFVLATNLIRTRAQLNTLIWVIMLALVFDGIYGFFVVMYEYNFDLSTVNSIAEHSDSVHMNTMYVLIMAVWLYHASPAKRFLLPPLAALTLVSYLANQRRAAFVTIALAILVIGFILYRERRNLFIVIAPPVLVLGALYLAVFWNSSGVLGAPASAIKSVVSENSASGADYSSNQYRKIENRNILYTLKLNPLRGVGFGKKFYVPFPMPNISFFEWWQYMPHNSILWIWLKMGLGGFLATMFLIGTAVVTGTRVLWRMPRGDMSAIALMALLYIMMHYIYAYVDISWDAQSMIYMGTIMGLINTFEGIVNREIPVAAKRWPWQPEPTLPPGLRSR